MERDAAIQRLQPNRQHLEPRLTQSIFIEYTDSRRYFSVPSGYVCIYSSVGLHTRTRRLLVQARRLWTGVERLPVSPCMESRAFTEEETDRGFIYAASIVREVHKGPTSSRNSLCCGSVLRSGLIAKYRGHQELHGTRRQPVIQRPSRLSGIPRLGPRRSGNSKAFDINSRAQC